MNITKKTYLEILFLFCVTNEKATLTIPGQNVDLLKSLKGI